MTEPRTEAGRRLLAVLTETRRWPLSMVDGTPRDAILAIEAEAAAGPRTEADPYQWLHDNDFSWDDVNAIAAVLDAGGFAIEAEAAAGSRDLERERVEQAFIDGSVEGSPIDHDGNLRAAAGPRDPTQPHGLSGLFHHLPGEPCVVCDREAAAGPRTDPDLEDWDTGTYREAEAAAGPRDDNLLRNYLEKLAAGPEPESPASAWLEGYRQGRIEAEAAAGPRTEGLDVDRLARAMWNVRAGGVIDNRHAAEVAREYAALAQGVRP